MAAPEIEDDPSPAAVAGVDDDGHRHPAPPPGETLDGLLRGAASALRDRGREETAARVERAREGDGGKK